MLNPPLLLLLEKPHGSSMSLKGRDAVTLPGFLAVFILSLNAPLIETRVRNSSVSTMNLNLVDKTLSDIYIIFRYQIITAV